MAEYIEREALIDAVESTDWYHISMQGKLVHGAISDGHALYKADDIFKVLADAPTIDAVPVVRCQNCIHAEPLDRNCEINPSVYMHCKIQRGEETKNVWHKYKKYYKDYSLVDRDGFCDEGERMDGE